MQNAVDWIIISAFEHIAFEEKGALSSQTESRWQVRTGGTDATLPLSEHSGDEPEGRDPYIAESGPGIGQAGWHRGVFRPR